MVFIDTPGFGDEFTSDEVCMAESDRAILLVMESSLLLTAMLKKEQTMAKTDEDFRKHKEHYVLAI